MSPNESRRFDLIVTDMDGTLLTSDKTVSPRTLAALERARAHGMTLMLASARPEFGLRFLAQRLGIDLTGLVLSACNGAVVCDATTGEVITETTLNQNVVQRTLEAADALGVAVITMSGDTVYITREDGYHVDREGPANGMKTVYTQDFSDLRGLHKLEISSPPERMPAVRAALDEQLSPIAETVLSSTYYYEVTAPGVTKGAGLKAYAAARGVDLSRAIAFGDQENDISMIEAAGTGVAMGNGADRLKIVADFVTRSHDDDGIAWALEELNK